MTNKYGAKIDMKTDMISTKLQNGHFLVNLEIKEINLLIGYRNISIYMSGISPFPSVPHFTWYFSVDGSEILP